MAPSSAGTTTWIRAPRPLPWYPTFFARPEYVLGYEDWDAFLESVTKVEVNGFGFAGEPAKELLEAIKKDCENGARNEPYNYTDVLGYAYVYTGDHEKYLSVSKDCTNTRSWLNEYAPGWDN